MHFQDIIAHTWPDHKDYEGLCDALKMLDGVAEHINTSITTSESLNKVLNIQNSFGGEVQVLPLAVHVPFPYPILS